MPEREGDAGQALMNAADVSASEVTAHFKKLLYNASEPQLPPRLADLPDMQELHGFLIEVRRRLRECAKGDFSTDLRTRGILSGAIKSVQANMRHLIWQMEQVCAGDLTQRVEFMGSFSDAFNSMVQKLIDVTDELRREVEKRGGDLEALQESSENFKYLAEHDPLTNLPNRRSFFIRADAELANNLAGGQHTCIAVMDVDHFKIFNDTHGHFNGDAALRHVAAIGRSALRDNDTMARLGGEEFAFLFSKSTAEQGVRVAERIRRRLEESPVVIDSGESVPVTASFGVICIPPSGAADSRDALLGRAAMLADAALYEAKDGGRNCVRLAEFPSGADSEKP